MKILNDDSIREIGRTYGRGKGATQLAKELGVSKQRIQQIVQKLRKFGAPIPILRSKKGSYEIIAEELKKEFN